MSAGQVQLDPEFLIRAAREIASEAASRYELYLAPEAMVGIDLLVKEWVALFSASDFDFPTWQGHVHEISSAVAKSFADSGMRRITSPVALQHRARALCAVYPCD
jgi:hypothetical protein